MFEFSMIENVWIVNSSVHILFLLINSIDVPLFSNRCPANYAGSGGCYENICSACFIQTCLLCTRFLCVNIQTVVVK